MVLPHNKRNFEAVKHLPRDETITYYGIFRGRQRECEIAGGTNVQFRPAYGQPSETFLLRQIHKREGDRNLTKKNTSKTING
mmetsp:Transcript_4771/g.10679  ORF Transcript_4771/g.10679 Transcript_4771/m.10679 type:complete len:82 (-) Transcript_4771:151-396(-)